MKTPIPTSNDPHLEITEETGPMEGYRMRHPSFGKVVLSRWSGSTKDHLFMSNVETYSGVSLEIHRAEVIRHHGHDTVFTKDHIIRIDLSPAQFADLLTNMNAEGAPCTIRYNAAEDGSLRATPKVPKMETAAAKVEAEFDQALKDLEFVDEDTLLKIRDAIDKLPAKHRTAVVEAVNAISSRVKSSLPFIRKQFESAVEQTVTQAKHEVAAYAQGMLHAAGVQALSQAPLLKTLGTSSEAEHEG